MAVGHIERFGQSPEDPRIPHTLNPPGALGEFTGFLAARTATRTERPTAVFDQAVGMVASREGAFAGPSLEWL